MGCDTVLPWAKRLVATKTLGGVASQNTVEKDMNSCFTTDLDTENVQEMAQIVQTLSKWRQKDENPTKMCKL